MSVHTALPSVLSRCELSCVPVCSNVQEEPTLIGSLSGKNVVQLATGASYSAAVTEDGLLFTWGKGAYGRLGHGELWVGG